MSLYLNGNSKTVYLNGIAYYLNIISSSSSPLPLEIAPITTLDGYELVDINGVYLTTKEAE